MLESYLNGINTMNGGGFEEKEIYALYGEANIGKTSYLIGEAVNMMNNGIRVVWIDTEGGFTGVWNKWYPVYVQRLVARFKLDDLFLYKRVLSVEEFCHFMGYDVTVDYGKSKISVILNGEAKKEEGTVYEKYGRMRGKLAVIVDSFSSPIKLQFSSAVQNFSGRADAESVMLMTLMKFMEKTSAFTIITNHESKNPTDEYHPLGSMRGGATLKYYSKHIMYFQKPLKKAWQDYRKVSAVRTPVAKDWQLFSWFKIDGATGYNDITAEEVEKTV